MVHTQQMLSSRSLAMTVVVALVYVAAAVEGSTPPSINLNYSTSKPLSSNVVELRWQHASLAITGTAGLAPSSTLTIALGSLCNATWAAATITGSFSPPPLIINLTDVILSSVVLTSSATGGSPYGAEPTMNSMSDSAQCLSAISALSCRARRVVVNVVHTSTLPPSCGGPTSVLTVSNMLLCSTQVTLSNVMNMELVLDRVSLASSSAVTVRSSACVDVAFAGNVTFTSSDVTLTGITAGSSLQLRGAD